MINSHQIYKLKVFFSKRWKTGTTLPSDVGKETVSLLICQLRISSRWTWKILLTLIARIDVALWLTSQRTSLIPCLQHIQILIVTEQPEGSGSTRALQKIIFLNTCKIGTFSWNPSVTSSVKRSKRLTERSPSSLRAPTRETSIRRELNHIIIVWLMRMPQNSTIITIISKTLFLQGIVQCTNLIIIHRWYLRKMCNL